MKEPTLGELKDTHPEVYKRAYECHVKHWGDPTTQNYANKKLLSELFVFEETIEGWCVWDELFFDGNYQPFYDFHGIKNPQSL